MQFHFAAETATKALLLAIGDPAAHGNLPAVLKATTKHLASQDPPLTVDGVSGIDQIRTIRNEAQHNARTPTLVEVQEARATTHLFLHDYFHVVWGLDFDQADVDEIADPEVRALFHREAEAAAKGDSTVAAGWTWQALDHAMRRCTGRIMRPFPSRVEVEIHGDHHTMFDRKDLTEAIKSAHSIAGLVALGLDPAELIRVQKALTGAPFTLFLGEEPEHSEGGREFSTEEAASARRMAIELILRVEQRSLDLAGPDDPDDHYREPLL